MVAPLYKIGRRQCIGTIAIFPWVQNPILASGVHYDANEPMEMGIYQKTKLKVYTPCHDIVNTVCTPLLMHQYLYMVVSIGFNL
jgi:hypothetical protein